MAPGEAPARPRWGRRVLLALLAALAVAVVALGLAVQRRLAQREAGLGVVQAPSEFAALEGSSVRRWAERPGGDVTGMTSGSRTSPTH